MTPAEACRYMADPANWRAGRLVYPGEGRGTTSGALRLATGALSDDAEILRVPALGYDLRQEDRHGDET